MNLKFDDLPKAISWMMNKLKELDLKLDGITSQSKEEPEVQWLNLKELCDYLPSHPAEQTVYGWTSCHQIPFHKKGKRIMFLKSEIDTWLYESKIKSPKELETDALRYVLNGGLERIQKASIKHSKFIYNETKRPKRSSLFLSR